MKHLLKYTWNQQKTILVIKNLCFNLIMRMNIFSSFYKKKNSTKNSAHPIHIYSRNKGSAAIILSLMVSGAVLSTIFHSQKNIDWFISSTEQSQEVWENHLTTKYGFTLGGYLVANNLILCKEGGWQDTAAFCKWNTDDSTVQLSEYNLEQPTVTTVDGRDVLTFEGQIDEPTLNNGEPLNYTISFDLVNWKDPNIQGLIGEIPKYTCRDTQTLEMISGACSTTPPDQEQCTNPEGNPISNSVCEYIEEVDQDFYIVLMLVKPAQVQQAHHAGIRRPLAHITTVLEGNAKCNMTCAAVDTGQRYPECRGEFQPPTGEERATLSLEITNHGPGAIYSLSFLKTQISVEKDKDGNPVSKFYKVTRNLLEAQEYLLPGKTSIPFTDTVTCLEEVRYSINGLPVRLLAFALPMIRDINVHAQPFMSLTYGMGSLLSPVGVCVENKFDGDGNRKQIKGNCGNTYSVDQTCGNGGVCLYPHIEPRRIFYPTAESINLDYITSVIRFVSPH